MRGQKPNSLSARVEAFYIRCPHEWLTWVDAATKFDCTVEQIKRCVEQLRFHGRLDVEVVSVLRVKEEA